MDRLLTRKLPVPSRTMIWGANGPCDGSFWLAQVSVRVAPQLQHTNVSRRVVWAARMDVLVPVGCSQWSTPHDTVALTT